MWCRLSQLQCLRAIVRHHFLVCTQGEIFCISETDMFTLQQYIALDVIGTDMVMGCIVYL